MCIRDRYMGIAQVIRTENYSTSNIVKKISMDRLTLIRNHVGSQANPIPLKPLKRIDLEYIDDGRIVVVYLNSPKDRNCLSSELMAEIVEVMNQINVDPNCKVLVLSSKVEKIFCAGADIRLLQTMTHHSQLHNDVFAGLTEALKTFKKVLISAVNGVAFGGGLELAMASDIVICTDDAVFGLPEIKLGIFPGLGGTQRLSTVAGKTNAMRYILTGDNIKAQEAKEMNIVSHIFKKENFAEETLKLARKICGHSSTALILVKEAILTSENVGLNEGMKKERDLFNAVLSLEGKKEGVDAFLNKRKPNFEKLQRRSISSS
eukprot:TRINITY_DN7800_c0_g1_i5.p1 TRINITY_DN7800_c0_g1~~TRINITY_DN7800_c0_g1_i5.p1  ORF type:complete len:319 (+),score=63.41 TRINITY_DN7800_c0_g1_i5:84-1040(+)